MPPHEILSVLTFDVSEFLGVLDLDLNVIHLGWTVFFFGGAHLFTHATWRCYERKRAAEEKLMPESILCVARMFFHLCGTLAILGWAFGVVGVFAIVRFTAPNSYILGLGAMVFCIAGYLEVQGINDLAIAIKRESKEGLWSRVGDVLRASVE